MVDRKGDAPAGLTCPHCNLDLLMSERQSIEIDYCPQCRGVWLDRGELDKIIERSLRAESSALPSQAVSDEAYYGRSHHGKSHHGKSHHGGYRRRSWLHDLFD